MARLSSRNFLISVYLLSPIVKNYDLSSVQVLACGAAPVSAELTDQLTKVLPNALVGTGYGMSPLPRT